LNFGSDNPELVRKSIDSLTYYLTIAPKMGMQGAVFHTGSHKGVGFEAVKAQVSDAFNQILDNTPEDSYLIIENNAGQGNLISRDATEIAALIDGVKQKDRVKVCIDTCHAFANGVDWRVDRVVDDFVAEYDRLVGWDRVVAIHTNDSKFEVGLNKDRHENIGEGFIGEKGFRNILSNKHFQEKPFILEVPGFDDKGPDMKNLERLREYSK
jgi:deoxyribonuclease-4